MPADCVFFVLCLPLQFHGGSCPYTNAGLLDTTQPYGVMECPPNCKGGKKGSKKRRHACKVRSEY